MLREILYLNSVNYFNQTVMDLPKQQNLNRQQRNQQHKVEAAEIVVQVYIENYIQMMLEDPLFAKRRAGLISSVSNTPYVNARGRNLFVSEKGYLGLVPTATRVGDVLVVFFQEGDPVGDGVPPGAG